MHTYIHTFYSSFSLHPHTHPLLEHIYSAVAVNIFHIINTFSVDITNNNFHAHTHTHTSLTARIFGMSDTPTRRVFVKVHPFPARIWVFVPLTRLLPQILHNEVFVLCGSNQSCG